MAGSERAGTAATPSTQAAAPAAISAAAPPAGTSEGDWNRRDAVGYTATPEQIEIDDRQKFQIRCLRNVHYHEDRERFFARLHKMAMFIIVLGAIATFAPIEKYWIASLVIAFAGLVDLVFDVSGKARLHASLRRRIYDVLADAQDQDADLGKLFRRLIDIYADEPPCMHAVNALAHNSAYDFFDRPKELRMKMEWWQRVFRNVWPFPQTDFKTFEELERQKLSVAAP